MASAQFNHVTDGTSYQSAARTESAIGPRYIWTVKVKFCLCLTIQALPLEAVWGMVCGDPHLLDLDLDLGL
jgi:hypothetical protein